MNNHQTRIWQIDIARGVAVIGMVIYHFLFDLEFIFRLPIGVSQIPLLLFARTVATLFILLVGISATIKFQKIKSKGIKKVVLSFGKKALRIFVYALIITGATSIVFPKETIIFGVLHFISLSLILLIPFLYLRSDVLIGVTGLLFISLGLLVSSITTTSPWLLFIGITQPSFSSFDYFPLLPWFGVVLLGLVLGRKYLQSTPDKNLTNRPYPKFGKILANLGRHSLPIYLWHQPILWSTLLLIDKMITYYYTM